MTEKDIQEYIWEKRLEFEELIADVEFPDKRDVSNPWICTPEDILFNMLIEKYEDIYSKLYDLHLFGNEVSLKKEGDSTIRADLLGNLGGANGIVILELKKSDQTARQSMTELLAYGHHLKTLLMPMAHIDIAYVLISPLNQRIVRESILNLLFFENKSVFVFEPIFGDEDDVNTLKLKPWIPEFDEVKNFINACFSSKNFDVFKVTWKDGDYEWDDTETGKRPTRDLIERMNNLALIASQKLDSMGIHGFAFTSNMWPEFKAGGYLTNGIIVVGLNPFKATKNRYHINSGKTTEEADESSIESINFLDLIPELKNRAEQIHLDDNYFALSSIGWGNAITAIAFDVVDNFTKKTDSSDLEKSWGSFTWDIYQQQMLEDVTCTNHKIYPSGIIRELYWKYSMLDYDYIQENGYKEHPTYSHGDIPRFMIELFDSQFYFRDFINRLFSIIDEDDI
ncbi:MAG TPA: hypothetical protein DF712_12745 [Balneola sp.]|nr:hypothetical protein [Bacteroidota bacterium]MAB66521.1 hypothetical protein [Bacteroidota bacterium]HCI72397.1 hypothetical protein [Balneola sp.]HCT53313.1 hypothetical protein [Balneola sp.]|tara:strand:+ start:4751 stop:6109 length:1359 start_codon:yes stop_codon:yes gene_type:complete